VQFGRVCGAAGVLDPGRGRLLGRLADGDDHPQITLGDLVQDAVAVDHDRRAGILGDLGQRAVVLPEDRVDERVQKDIPSVQPDVPEEVLHPRAGAAGEGAMRQ